MQSNLQTKKVIQYSSDLMLVLLDKKEKTLPFPVFHSRTVKINEWVLHLEIIGESHRIELNHLNSELSLTEILACLPPESDLKSPCYEGNITDCKNNRLEKALTGGRYEFSYKKLHFSDSDYVATIFAEIEGGEEMVCYDFKSHKKDGLPNLYGPTTMISVKGDEKSIFWTSLHGYPNEKSTVLSQSSITLL